MSTSLTLSGANQYWSELQANMILLAIKSSELLTGVWPLHLQSDSKLASRINDFWEHNLLDLPPFALIAILVKSRLADTHICAAQAHN